MFASDLQIPVGGITIGDEGEGGEGFTLSQLIVRGGGVSHSHNSLEYY